MKYFKCENCGADLTKNENGTYSCAYCKRTYYDDSLEKAYDRVYQNLRGTVQGIVSEELLKQKIEQIATCRQALYKECNEQFVDNTEIERWAGEILKLSPKDAQANFYFLAAKKRWSELNKFMQKLNAREVPYLVDGFVDYLTNGQFAEKCVLCLNDLIDRAFEAGSKEYAACHKKIVTADERERSGVFDVSLPRDVFVAYSSKDKEKAYELVEYLEKNGFTCFIAMRNLAKGVDAALKYNERLKTAMDSCRVFLLVSSTNSRARDCDAYRIEMQYIRDCDCKKANDFALASARYEEYLEKNRNRCKPRVEYLIEDYGSSPYEKIVKKFFGGLTWCRSLESVSAAVFELIESAELEATQEEKFARERAEFEAQKAELAKKEKELSRNQNASAPSGNIDDLYKAFKERERAEEERKRKEEEERKRQEELERQRQAEEEERKRQEEIIKRDFEIENGVLKKYKGNGGNVTIPNSVTEIGVSAFEKCTRWADITMPNSVLTNVTIPNSVTLIGNRAFFYCTSLTNVTIPDSVTRIGASAFCDCTSLTNVTIPDSVTEIGASAFEDCKSLTNVMIPDSVTWIGERAFIGCKSLTSVTIGNSVTLIGKRAFAGCNYLQYSEYDNAKYLGNKNNKYFALVEAKDISIKSCIIHKNTKLIVGGAFNGCASLTSVTIPDFVTGIGVSAFERCTSLTSVKIPNSVTEIGAEAFKGCTGLTWVNLPENVTIGKDAFDKETEICHLKTEVEYKRKKEEEKIKCDFEIVCGILKKYKGKGGNVTIPDSVTKIGGSAFERCTSLRSVKIPNSVTWIGERAFMDCRSLTSVTIPDSVTSIGEMAFEKCKSLTSVKIPNSVTEIGHAAFYGCASLTNVTIPDSVTGIGGSAFGRCTSLTNVRIPNSVTKIGDWAFDGCTSLTNVTIPDSVTGIGKEAFCGCARLASVTIPNSVYLIGVRAFKGCASLTSVTIPDSVTRIGEETFVDCTSLTSVTIPNSVAGIEINAFRNCNKLTIYAQAKSKPKGWVQPLFGKDSWNPDKRPVKWGVGK